MKIDYVKMMEEAFSQEKKPIRYPSYGYFAPRKFPPKATDQRYGYFGITDSSLVLLLLGLSGRFVAVRIEIPFSDIIVTKIREKWLSYEIRFQYPNERGKKSVATLGLYKKVRFADFKDQPNHSRMLCQYFDLL